MQTSVGRTRTCALRGSDHKLTSRRNPTSIGESPTYSRFMLKRTHRQLPPAATGRSTDSIRGARVIRPHCSAAHSSTVSPSPPSLSTSSPCPVYGGSVSSTYHASLPCSTCGLRHRSSRFGRINPRRLWTISHKRKSLFMFNFIRTTTAVPNFRRVTIVRRSHVEPLRTLAHCSGSVYGILEFHDFDMGTCHHLRR